MKKIQLIPALVMDQQDIELLNNLPDNMPDNKLKPAQIATVNAIYWKYIGRNIDNQTPGLPLYEKDRKNEKNWPSGPRMKAHEAKRVVLNWLLMEQKQRDNLAEHFLIACRCRPVYAEFVGKAYEII